MRLIKVYRSGIHLGEEKVIDGNHKSGMITFSGCHLSCNFCYTPETSVHALGSEYTPRQFYELLNELITRGARNINLISPSHLWGGVREPLRRIKSRYGKLLPIVLKISGYEAKGLIQSFTSVADIVVPDFKVWTPSAARNLNLPLNYGKMAQNAILEMMETHGKNLFTEETKLSWGLLVRHLIMPDYFKDSLEVVTALVEIRYQGYLNLMTYYLDKKNNSVLNANPDQVAILAHTARSGGMKVLINGRPEPNERIQYAESQCVSR